ncbi:trefoil factor 2-like [Hydra vulgaris]|uniref:Trefoil factor 2-like n=1 Tax=Hydra vulgaris TaxID=6087 RepID=A0ABM4CV09_HYDVU
MFLNIILSCFQFNIFLKYLGFDRGKVLQCIFALLSCCSYTYGENDRCTEIAPNERTECGYPGISDYDCLKRNCCWDSSITYVIWCFFPTSLYY